MNSEFCDHIEICLSGDGVICYIYPLDIPMHLKFLDVPQARRQEFPEGGSSTRVALTAGGLGAAHGPQKLWGIWNKILKSSNFRALHSNFRKVMFFKTDYMIFTKFYTNLSINF